jgi:hypothetical protein
MVPFRRYLTSDTNSVKFEMGIVQGIGPACDRSKPNEWCAKYEWAGPSKPLEATIERGEVHMRNMRNTAVYTQLWHAIVATGLEPVTNQQTS